MGTGASSHVVATLVYVVGSFVIGISVSRLVEWPVIRLRDRYFPSRSGTATASEGTAGAQERSMTLTPASPSAAARPPLAPPAELPTDEEDVLTASSDAKEGR